MAVDFAVQEQHDARIHWPTAVERDSMKSTVEAFSKANELVDGTNESIGRPCDE